LKIELTPSPFPLPSGERIKVRGKRKFLYYQVSKASFAATTPHAVAAELALPIEIPKL